MLLIRKFVGCIKVAAAVSGVLVLGLSTQSASAGSVSLDYAGGSPVTNLSNINLPAPSAACVASLQAIKTAFANDRSEDAAERVQASLEPDSAADQTEDATELANFKALFSAARTACAASIAAVVQAHKATGSVSSQCTAAVQAWKAAVKSLWASHTRPTSTEVAQLRTLGANARAACGWTWNRR
ncbi:MAG TPA: hypothetical protein VEM94_10450 [Candidatus Dormibacteraeota bacterium]|nr:hypothetical protein [Candidatus Dormibacteraeota bacterium]